MTTPIHVIAKDIAMGKHGSIFGCAIVRAMKRATGNPCAYGGKARGWIGRREIAMPPACAEFAARFDTGSPVAPFTFELEI